MSEAVALPPLLDDSVTVYVPAQGGAGSIKLNVRVFCALNNTLNEKLSEKLLQESFASRFTLTVITFSDWEQFVTEFTMATG